MRCFVLFATILLLLNDVDSFSSRPQQVKKSTKNYELNRQILQQTSIQDILNYYSKNYKDYNNVNYCTSFHRLARFIKWGDDESKTVKNDTRQSRRAKLLLDAKFGVFCGSMCQYFCENVPRFKGQEISNLVWSIAQIQVLPKPIRIHETFTVPELQTESQVLVSSSIQLAKFNVDQKDHLKRLSLTVNMFLSLLVEQFLSMIKNSKTKVAPYELANMIYSLGFMRVRKKNVYDQLIDRLVRCENYKAQEVSNTIWSCATVKHFSTSIIQLFHSISQVDVNKKHGITFASFKSQELSNSLWGTATMVTAIENADDVVKEVIDILATSSQYLPIVLSSFKPQEQANTLWAMANLYMYVSSKGVVDTTIDDNIKVLFQEVETCFRRDRKGFKPQELNNLVWATCKLASNLNVNLDKEDVFSKTIRNILDLLEEEVYDRKLRGFVHQDVSTIIYSWANLDRYNEDFFNYLLRPFLNQMEDFKSQELSNMMYAYGRVLPPTRTPVLNALIKYTSGLPCNVWKEQEMKDLLWSFSRLGITDGELFQQASENLITRDLTVLFPQSISILAWSFARQAQLTSSNLNPPASRNSNSNNKLALYLALTPSIRKMFQSLVSVAKSTGYEKFATQDLSNLVWALGVFGLSERFVIKDIVLEMIQRLSNPRETNSNPRYRFLGMELSMFIWGLAIMNFGSVNDGENQALCGTLFTKVGEYLNETYRVDLNDDSKLKSNLKAIARSFKRGELTSVAWSMAVLDIYNENLLKYIYVGLFGDAYLGRDSPRITSDDLKKAYQDDGLNSTACQCLLTSQLWLCMNYPNRHESLRLPASFLDNYLSEEVELSENDVNVSKLQTSVLDTILRLRDSNSSLSKFDLTEEYSLSNQDAERLMKEEKGIIDFLFKSSAVLERGVLSVDMLLKSDDLKICVEVDGPSHFISDLATDTNDHGAVQRSDWYNGSSTLKARLLDSLNFKLIQVPYFEYSPNSDPLSQEEYLFEKLCPYL